MLKSARIMITFRKFFHILIRSTYTISGHVYSNT